MSTDAQDVLQAALELSEGERADIAAKLIDSLDPTLDDAWVQAWEVEIARRIAEVDEGRAELTPWSEVRQLLASRSDAKKDR